MSEKKHIKYIPFISSLAAIGVLYLHTNGCFWYFTGTETYWKSANIIECIFYASVPMFFMISGITLIDFYDRTDLKGFFKKRFNKAFVPFVAWSLIVFVIKIITKRITLGEINPKFIYEGIIGNQFVSIFWFFAPLFCIYLSMPLFAAVKEEKRKEVFTYLVAAGLILNILIPFIKRVFDLDFSTPYTVNVLTGSLIWVPIGWLLHNTKLKKYQKAIIYTLAAAGLLLHIIGTYKLSKNAGKVVETFKGYQNLPCVLYATGLFLLLKETGTKIMHGKTEQFFNWLSTYAFPIYLMQFIFITALPELPFVDETSLIYRLGAPIIIVPVIIGITWILRKIPLIRRIVP